MQKITTFLWFDTQAEEAAKFYTSIFKDSKINAISHYGEGMPMPRGTVMTVGFTLAGQEFTALNGGPQFKFTEAISLVVNCETQQEIDYFWDKLTSSGGQPIECGWLKDRYGLCWQVVPTALGQMMKAGDATKTNRMMAALMTMKKLDVAELQKAYEGK
jgi:predicted 3-demethylubiquinone-9 3-methyltransferase (glyoxalase superfamily)